MRESWCMRPEDISTFKKSWNLKKNVSLKSGTYLTEYVMCVEISDGVKYMYEETWKNKAIYNSIERL